MENIKQWVNLGKGKEVKGGRRTFSSFRASPLVHCMPKVHFAKCQESSHQHDLHMVQGPFRSAGCWLTTNTKVHDNA